MDVKPRTQEEQELLNMIAELTPAEKALAIEYARAVRDDDQTKIKAMEKAMRQRAAAAEGQRQGGAAL